MWTYKILSTILATTALLAGSCSDSVAPVQGEKEPEAGMRLRIDVVFDDGLKTGATRADESYEAGIGYENYIDIDNNDFRVLFFNDNDKYIGTFTEMNISKTEGTNGLLKYEIEGKVRQSLISGNNPFLKAVLLANWKTYPDVSTESSAGADDATSLSDLAQASSYGFSATTDIQIDARHLIPMIGILTEADIFANPTNSGHYNLGEMRMLRAYAKIEVQQSDASTHNISEVFMTKVNTRGYKFPLGITKEDQYNPQMDEAGGIRFTTTPSIPASTQNVTDIKFVKTTAEGKNNWVIYVPEFQNILSDGTPDDSNRSKIGIKFEGIDDQSYYVDFRYYDTPDSKEGKHFDILRNNWYVYKVGMKEKELTATVDIQPYAEQILRIDYGLMRDERGDLMVLQDSENNFPQFFLAYMGDKNSGKWPVDGNNNELIPRPGDYYALVLRYENDANMSMGKYEVWLKDSDGCRIMTNLSDRSISGNDADCSTRLVRDYSEPPLSEFKEYQKDTDGHERLQHNDDHSSVVRNHQKQMLFKTDPHGDIVKTYPVESWDSKSGNFWYLKEISEPYTATEENVRTALGLDTDAEIPEQYLSFITNNTEVVTCIFYEGDKTGNDTGNTSKVIEDANADDLSKLLR